MLLCHSMWLKSPAPRPSRQTVRRTRLRSPLPNLGEAPVFLRTYYWGVPSRSVLVVPARGRFSFWICERGVAGLRAARRGSSKICRSTRPLRPSGLSSRSIEAANVLFLVLALPRKPKSSPNAKVVSAAAPIRRRGFKLVAPPSAHLLFGTTRPALLSDGSRRQRQFSRLESRCALGCQRDIGSGSSSNDKVARDRAGLCLGKCCFVSVKDFAVLPVGCIDWTTTKHVDA